MVIGDGAALTVRNSEVVDVAADVFEGDGLAGIPGIRVALVVLGADLGGGEEQERVTAGGVGADHHEPIGGLELGDDAIIADDIDIGPDEVVFEAFGCAEKGGRKLALDGEVAGGSDCLRAASSD